MTLTRENLLKLQNGSDVRGVAIDGLGEAVTLTEEAVNRIAGAFVVWLEKNCSKKAVRIGVGHDSRLSADALSKAALKGLKSAGAQTVFCGLASTPSMFMGTVYEQTKFDGSIMITASHLPYNRNGMKFFTKDGGLEKSEITEVLEIAATTATAETVIDAVEKVELLQIYAADLRQKIENGVGSQRLSGVHIVVDASNGAGGFFAKEVLEALGADVSGSQFLEPDGHFPNHVPNPESPEAMDSLRDAVLKNKADFGLIFDPDVDRMSAVLADGKEINRDALIALMAAIAVKDCPGGTIVTDSVTSDTLTDFLENTLQCRHRRFKRGYKNVINECKRLNADQIVSPLAIETSGHGAFQENYYLDDGCYMAVKLIMAAVQEKRQGRDITALIADLKEAYEAREYRMNIKETDFKSYGQEVLSLFESRAKEKGIHIEPDSCEGVRLSFKGVPAGWALLRASLHDPVLALNMEGSKAGDCEAILGVIHEILADRKGIVLDNLK